MLDRYGPQRMILLTSLAFGLVYIATSQVNGAVGVFLAVLGLRWLGFGSMQMVSNNLISQ
jgi:hypothetical protein